MNNTIIPRRRFLRDSAAAFGTSLFMIPQLASLAGPESVKEENRLVRFGVMTDVHKDVIHDADQRLEVFINRMTQLRPDFVIQLGDFCIPIPENQAFLEIWKRFDGPRIMCWATMTWMEMVNIARTRRMPSRQRKLWRFGQ